LAPDRDGRPWRYLERGVQPVEVTVLDDGGAERRFSRRVEVPPYLLAGETARVTIGPLPGVKLPARKVRLVGPLLEGAEVEPQR
jgi:hypothetical protein